MKTMRTLKLALFASLAITQIACSENDSPLTAEEQDQLALTELQNQINTLPKESLSESEIASLMHLREEEKLAQDVYLFLYNRYKVNIFNNIRESEITHMDAVGSLIAKYELDDPIDTNGPGVFKNQDLQELYNSLTAQGSVSLLNAYIVGATIEDLDLYDLAHELTLIDNQDIITVYESLAKGSRNHMRSFYDKITSSGGNYTPQFISQELFNSIISTPKETGNI